MTDVIRHVRRALGRHWIAPAGLVLIVAAPAVPPAVAQSDCDEKWTIGGHGSSDPWLRTNGYRIGMTKSEAIQIRRTGLRGSIAQDHWQLMLSAARVVLDFEDGKLGSATIILDGADYQEVYPAVMEQMGPPDDFAVDYLLWRDEACDTVKLIKDDGGNVVMLVQSLDYFSRNTLGGKTKKR